MATGATQKTVNVLKGGPAQVGNFGANGAVPQTVVAVSADATDLAEALVLLNEIKAALIACGLLEETA